MTLKHVLKMLDDIASTTKRTEKEKFIEKYIKDKDFVSVVKYSEDSFKLYKTQSIPYIPNSKKCDIKKAFDLLDTMSNAAGVKKDTINLLGELCSVDKETHEVFTRIVTKDLRCSVGLITWIKYIPDLTIHSVMLCIDDLDKFLEYVDNDYSKIMDSIKKDGVRVWAICKNDNVTYKSRNGKEYKNFSVFDDELLDIAHEINKKKNIQYPIIFDGEVTSKDNKFDSLTAKFKKKDYDNKENIFKFAVFDLVDTAKKYKFIDRYDLLNEFLETDSSKRISLLEHRCNSYKSRLDIIEHMDRVIADGDEGLVLKYKDGYYEPKRSKNWCKIKRFNTLDLPVVDIEMGKGKYKGKLGALIVDHNGVNITVGSGYSDELRETFLTTPPTMIEVKYQEITKDGSLRFPVFVRDRSEDKN
jgi:DNA ligase-1